jgi:hypothetical protein
MFLRAVLAIVILFGMFFLIFGFISFSRCFVAANRSKQHERILKAPVSAPAQEQDGVYSENIVPEDHARDANSSSMSRSTQLFQHARVFSAQPFPMGNAGPSLTVNDGLRTAPEPARHEVSAATLCFLMPKQGLPYQNRDWS